MTRSTRLLARGVLLLGLLTTVATSAPADYTLVNDASVVVAQTSSLHTTVTGNWTAVNHATSWEMVVQAVPADKTATGIIWIIPDDERLEPKSIDLSQSRSVEYFLFTSEIADRNTDVCPIGSDCRFGFAIEFEDGIGEVEIDLMSVFRAPCRGRPLLFVERRPGLPLRCGNGCSN